MNHGLRQLGSEHLDEVVRFRIVSFGGDGEEVREREERSLASGLTWGLVEGERLLATTRLSLVDHWFGGRRVSCQHVSSVAVPPEHRGRGAASALMRGVIDRGLAEGAGLSLLYPATTALYRRLGWEHAGTLARYRIDAHRAPALSGGLRPADGDGDWAAIRASHEATGRFYNGPSVRDERGWERLRQTPFVYVLDADDGRGIEAYLCYTQRTEPSGWQFSIAVTDWGATTPRGLAAILGLIGRHGTIGKDAHLSGPVPHPWTFLAPEQDLEHAGGMFWMARGLDLPGAIAARGFPPGIALEVTFAVDDPLNATANGPWRLEIASGAAKLTPAPAADLTLNARAFGPLYTGFTTPSQLALAGLLTGPPDPTALLTTAFAGPAPVLFEFF